MVEQELVRRTELRSTLVSRLWKGGQTHSSRASSAKSSLSSESLSGHTASSSWPVGGASACDPDGRPACWPSDPKPACLQLGGADTQVAPAAVTVRPVRAFGAAAATCRAGHRPSAGKTPTDSGTPMKQPGRRSNRISRLKLLTKCPSPPSRDVEEHDKAVLTCEATCVCV